ncbi:amino acid adenylation domain-containing protein [uncultured Kordia sp.]|uniref:amino acid adenylation domain-containing protein n=1 Tax=uncultured Kordia sp. TaxID=507699 RepID=UPI00261D8BF2|nr:amino acid adenylation domain-containing protein [uncultured Kordia sp.]
MDKLIQSMEDNPAITICGLIKEQMLAHPERIAIVDGETNIEYQRLMKKVSEVAGELKNRGVKPGALVGICMNRTWELVATLIGVMQAGCAYVPLDPAYPKDRIKYMLAHSKAEAAIVDTDITANLCNEVRELVWIQKIGNHTDTVVRPSEYDLAYVIYTSGSTGKPKGVAVEHKSVVAMRQSVRNLFSDEELNGMLAAASVCFDTSVMEIMGTLSLGGKIILVKNALELTQIPALDQVRTFVMVPSSVQALLSTEKLPENIKCLIFGGEALKRSLVEQVYAHASISRVLNAYGPTEDTVYSTISEVPRDAKVITIGKSVPDSRAYILDDHLQPVSNGDAGELHLAGTKLARGYLYDEEKTKERFIEITPTDLITDHRLYKTGDLCRWAENGEIEFLGRVDQQVKIRGFRIELEEIESTLESMEGISAVAAAAVEGGIGQKMLVVYVVKKNESISTENIKSYLSERLPRYMVPQVVKYLEALPLLPNDKLDRKKLMQMEKIQVSQSETDDLQQILADSNNELETVIRTTILKEITTILNLGDPKQISPDESFNALGLDSLTTLEFSSRLSKLVGKKITAPTIFEYPTPNSLANYIVHIESGNVTNSTHTLSTITTNSLANFQSHIQSSHPTFQAAKAMAWNVTDKSKLVQEVMRMVNDNRRNPYSKVLKTGSATRGIVGDAYNDEEQEAIIWTTNLYLGLNRDKEVMAEASKALNRFGTGMGTSAAASGMTNQHLEFETEFADLVGKPSACLFPTGYTANVGAVAGLLGRNDVVVIDQLCHASIVDGARLCGATIRTFQHNNVEDLEAVLKSEISPYRSILVVLEGVYSMGEGAAPVAKIVRTAKKYDALVLVDEAHSFGFYGKGGAGICADQGVTEEVDFIMTTLSKALGSLGGVVAASQEHVDLLKSSSRAYIFQASVSPADMAAALTSLRRLRSDDALRGRLWETTRYMRKQFEDAGYDLGTGDGPIVTPHFSDKDKLYAIVQHMYKRGVQTSAVTYPIVESGKGRLRFICSAAHTKDDVDKTLAALIAAEQQVDSEVMMLSNEVYDTDITNADLENWTHMFINYMKKVLAESSAPVPNLGISIHIKDATHPISFLIKDKEVTLSFQDNFDVSYCSLLLMDKVAVSALQTFNIQGLLDSICKGTCVLNGQIEPFIWFVGRIVDYQKEVQELSSSKHTTSEEAIA